MGSVLEVTDSLLERTGSLVEEAISEDDVFVSEETVVEDETPWIDVLPFDEFVDGPQEARRMRLAARTSNVCCFMMSSQ